MPLDKSAWNIALRNPIEPILYFFRIVINFLSENVEKNISWYCGGIGQGWIAVVLRSILTWGNELFSVTPLWWDKVWR